MADKFAKNLFGRKSSQNRNFCKIFFRIDYDTLFVEFKRKIKMFCQFWQYL